MRIKGINIFFITARLLEKFYTHSMDIEAYSLIIFLPSHLDYARLFIGAQ